MMVRGMAGLAVVVALAAAVAGRWGTARLARSRFRPRFPRTCAARASGPAHCARPREQGAQPGFRDGRAAAVVQGSLRRGWRREVGAPVGGDPREWGFRQLSQGGALGGPRCQQDGRGDGGRAGLPPPEPGREGVQG